MLTLSRNYIKLHKIDGQSGQYVVYCLNRSVYRNQYLSELIRFKIYLNRQNRVSRCYTLLLYYYYFIYFHGKNYCGTLSYMVCFLFFPHRLLFINLILQQHL